MAYAKLTYTGLDGSTNAFDVTFPYLAQTHVLVTVNGVATTDFTWTTSSRITLTSTPASDSTVVITRSSSRNARLVDYQTGSILSENILDTDSLQAFYMSQEAIDSTEATITKSEATAQWDAGALRITNGATPTADTDFATKGYADTAPALASSVSAAAASALAAETAETGAETAETGANTAKVGAETAKAGAETAETAAELAETNAETAEANAAASAAAALVSQNAAANTLSSLLYSTVTDKTADYTAVAGDDGTMFRVNTTSGPVTITLPQVSDTDIGDGWRIAVVKSDGSDNALTISRAGSSDLINGAATYVIENQWDTASIVADDADPDSWIAIGSGAGAGNKILDTFTGAGQPSLSLSADPGTENNVHMTWDGVTQHHSSFNVSGNTLSLTDSATVPTGVAVECTYGTTLATGVPADASVSSTKLASDAVQTSHITDLNVTTGKLADLNVTTGKLAAGAVTLAKVNNALLAYDIGFNAAYDTAGVKTDVVAQVYSNMILARDITIEGFEAYAETAPVGSSLIMDVLKNGTTIWTTKPEIDAAANADDTYHSLSVTTADAGDRITFSVTQIGSSTAGQGLTATLKARLR